MKKYLLALITLILGIGGAYVVYERIDFWDVLRSYAQSVYC